MLSSAQAQYISSHAWVPEHLADYVTAVSGKEAFLRGDFVCYAGQGALVVVGYPLCQTHRGAELVQVLEQVSREFRPQRLWLIAPEIPPWRGLRPTGASDSYFSLELEHLKLPPKVRNMIRRASKELEVQESSCLGPEHKILLEEFFACKELSPQSQEVLRALPRYVEKVGDSVVFSGFDKTGRLVSFCIGQMGQGEWSFYMFHVNSPLRRIPGASDMLLDTLVKKALEHNKHYLNLGLGINPGVAFFKKKWGARVLAPYKEACFIRRNWRSMLETFFLGKGEGPDVEP